MKSTGHMKKSGASAIICEDVKSNTGKPAPGREKPLMPPPPRYGASPCAASNPHDVYSAVLSQCPRCNVRHTAIFYPMNNPPADFLKHCGGFITHYAICLNTNQPILGVDDKKDKEHHIG